MPQQSARAGRNPGERRRRKEVIEGGHRLWKEKIAKLWRLARHNLQKAADDAETRPPPPRSLPRNGLGRTTRGRGRFAALCGALRRGAKSAARAGVGAAGWVGWGGREAGLLAGVCGCGFLGQALLNRGHQASQSLSLSLSL